MGCQCHSDKLLGHWTHLARTNAISLVLCHQASVNPSEPAEFISNCQLLTHAWQCRIKPPFFWLKAFLALPLSFHTLSLLPGTTQTFWSYYQHLKGISTSYQNYIMIFNDELDPSRKKKSRQCMLVLVKASFSGCGKISVNYIMD